MATPEAVTEPMAAPEAAPEEEAEAALEPAPEAVSAASAPPVEEQNSETDTTPPLVIAQQTEETPVSFSDADNTGNDVLDASARTDSLRISGGHGKDKITDGQGDDHIEGGLGRDTISLASGGADTVYYWVHFNNANGEATAIDGQDKITGFTLGEDSLVFRTNALADRGDAGRIAVLLGVSLNSYATIDTVEIGSEEHVKGFTFVLNKSGKTATGRSSGRRLIIEFNETEALSTLLPRIGNPAAENGQIKITSHLQFLRLVSIFGSGLWREEIISKPSNRSDILKTSDQNESTSALAGDDVINASAGDDVLDGGPVFECHCHGRW